MRRTKKSSTGDFEFSNSSLSSRALVFVIAVVLGIGVMATIKSMINRPEPEETLSEERELKPKNALKRVQLSPKKQVQPEPVYTPPPAEPAPVVQNTVRTKKASRARVIAGPTIQQKSKFVATPKVSAPMPLPQPVAPIAAPAPAPTVVAAEPVAPPPTPAPAPTPVSRPEPTLALRDEAEPEVDDPVFEAQASHRRDVDHKIKLDETKKKSAHKSKEREKDREKDKEKEKRIEIAQEKSGPQTFKDRLKKSRQEVDEASPAADTATSSFQDRLRKSVK